MKKLVRISRIGAIVNVENNEIVLASPKEIDLKGIGYTNTFALTGSFYDSIVEAKRVWKDLDVYTCDSDICFYKEVVIK